MTTVSACSSCGGKNQYRSKEFSAGGLTRFFARPEAMEKLPESKSWTRA